MNLDLILKKALTPITDRQTAIEKRQEEMSGQLTSLQNSMELLLSFYIDDDKKGEMIAKSKCTPSIKGHKEDDDATDGGNKGGNPSMS